MLSASASNSVHRISLDAATIDAPHNPETTDHKTPGNRTLSRSGRCASQEYLTHHPTECTTTNITRLKNPFSPQALDQEFFTTQYFFPVGCSIPYPTCSAPQSIRKKQNAKEQAEVVPVRRRDRCCALQGSTREGQQCHCKIVTLAHVIAMARNKGAARLGDRPAVVLQMTGVETD